MGNKMAGKNEAVGTDVATGIAKYKGLIPEGTTSRLMYLSDPKNYGIVLYLICEGSANLEKMSCDLGLSNLKCNLSYRLDALEKYGLVERSFTDEHPMGGKFRPRFNYAATLLCKQTIVGLADSQNLTEEHVDKRLEELFK